jgi:threonine synthase
VTAPGPPPRPPSGLACSGCGAEADDRDPYPFRCPNAGRDDDVDHVLVRVLDLDRVRWPAGGEANPFVRYRELFRSHHVAMAGGMTDAEYVDLVEALDKEVAAVAGHGFGVTPFERHGDLGGRLGLEPGGVWAKDETGNVSGSHKGRHLMGVMVHLEVAERLGLTPPGPRPDLAIASCGNAALAATVVARAAGRRLRVFVPPDADPAVLGLLQAHGASITECPRESGVPGDPTHPALRRALAEGALPFTCQGSENGLAVEGGLTLGYELASGLAGQRPLDRLFVQVGGGALASACIQGLWEAQELGAIRVMPRVHAVQTAGASPLRRAYDLLAERVLARIEEELGDAPEQPEDDEDRALFMRRFAGSRAVRAEIAEAARHRSGFMWPWEEVPASVAFGILDDETYDWLAVVRGMIETGGYPVVADEPTLLEANELARASARVPVDHTGSAGLAGLMELRSRGAVRPDERVAVLFTGIARDL